MLPQAVLSIIVICISNYVVQLLLKSRRRKVALGTSNKPIEVYSNNITPMPNDFNWKLQEPERYRPMKNGVYKITMALKSLKYDDYILMDKNYVERTNIRIKIAEELPEETILFNEVATDAICEYYDYVTNFYLKRFPMMFQEKGKEIYNVARDEYLPLNSSNHHDPRELLKLLARHMEDDFLILLKSPVEDEYILRAGTAIFPNGFNPLFNLNKKLTTIHQPVPQYESKLKLLMNKFFDRVKPYQFVYRVNWGIQTHTNLFALTGNHGRPQEHSDVLKLDANLLNFNEIFLRSERQVLTRLPKSGATVLSLKTYLTPLTKIRDEGLAETLIGAIDGLPDDIAIYKNRPKWGDAVKSYMKGETNGITEDVYDFKFTT